MRNSKFIAAGSRLIPIAALLLTTALGGCVAYPGYPSNAYNNSDPGGYYTGYPAYYANSPAHPPTYYRNYYRYENNDRVGGGG